VLRGDLVPATVHEVQRDAVAGLDRDERPEGRTDLQPENRGQEFGGRSLVAGRDDGVVQLDRHLASPGA
jgi:hypothetical protein